MTSVFIDGSAGTTGLRIHDRLSGRDDISLIELPEECRKDECARKEALNKADIAFLCLPDDAAKEAVSFIINDSVKVIDTSTAHRTADGWIYGFPEFKGYRDKIKNSNRIANPGCHAGGFIALVKPLVEAGLILPATKLTSFSLTGYSGAGKAGIAQYEGESRDKLLDAPRQYALAQSHKHLKEMTVISGLETQPIFCPIIAPFYSGMEVTVTLFKDDLKGTVENIKELYKNYYNSGVVRYRDSADEAGFLSSIALSGRDDMEISVFGNDDRILLISRFDNLGKGASGAAVQNMNVLLGVEETKGLDL